MNREQLKEKYGDEMVLVVEDRSFANEAKKAGVVHASERILGFLASKAFFVPRYQVEGNPDFRQIIPYVVVRVNGEYFVTQRLEGSGEKRLHGKMSLGVGGHINPVDDKAGIQGVIKPEIFLDAMWRELREEISFPVGELTIDLVGLINDCSDDVGKDHVGLLFIADLIVDDPDLVCVKEKDVLSGKRMDEAQIGLNKAELENWSRIVFEEVICKWGIE